MVSRLLGGACFQKATSLGASVACPCSSGRRLGRPGSTRSLAHFAAACSGAPVAPRRGEEPGSGPQHVAIVGGGPVGLALAARLAQEGGLSVRVYDSRWEDDGFGGLQWRPGACADVVVAVPRHALVPWLCVHSDARLPGAVEVFEGEEMWPECRNIHLGRLQERLLERLQERDLAGSVLLSHAPKLDGQSGQGDGDRTDLRAWLEELSAGDATAVVLADGPLGEAACEALADLLRLVPAGGPAEDVLSVSLDLPEVSPQGRLVSMAICCAQSRFVFSPDETCRRAHLGIRLSAAEGRTVLAEAMGETAATSSVVRLYARSGAGGCRELRGLERQPLSSRLVEEGVGLFGLGLESVRSVSFAGSAASRGHGQLRAFVARHGGSPKASEEACSALGSGAGRLPQVFSLLERIGAFEASGAPGGCPSGGCLSGFPRHLEAGDALARVLVAGAPSSAFECFMQGRRRWGGGAAEPGAGGCDAGAFAGLLASWCEALGGPAEEAGRALATSGVPLATLLPWASRPPSADPGLRAAGRSDASAELEATPAVAAFATSLAAERALAAERPEEASGLLDPAPSAASRREPDLFGLVVRAEARLRLGRLSKARRDADRALRLHLDNPWALAVRAKAALRSGCWESAVEDCDTLLRADPHNVAGAAMRGEAKLFLGLHDEAVADCSLALAFGPRRAPVLAVRAEALRLQGCLREAILDCDEALGLERACRGALGTRGRCQLELGKFQQAVADLGRAVEGAPAAPLLVARAEARVHLREFEEAVADCSAALAEAEDALAFAVRAEAQLLAGRPRECLADCERALALEPSDAYTWAVRGQASLLESRCAEAVRHCERALELCPQLEIAGTVRARARAQAGGALAA